MIMEVETHLFVEENAHPRGPAIHFHDFAESAIVL